MNASRLVIGAVALVAVSRLAVPGAVCAQDLAKVAPNSAKVLLDNDRVRVIEINVKAGEKIPMHSHPAYVLYSMTSGKTKSTTADGKTTERETKAGTATWNDGETHSAENTGTTDGRVLLVELKEPQKK
jgi:quercetin dioxygenase-like cupin family protein